MTAAQKAAAVAREKAKRIRTLDTVCTGCTCCYQHQCRVGLCSYNGYCPCTREETEQP